MKKNGAKVTFGCSIEFKDQVLDEDLDFYEMDISANRNVGKAINTDQPDTERMRLEEFFESTKKGAIETLITQSHHRKADMLYNPGKLIKKIREADQAIDVDLFVVDILSYSVTLGLYFVDLPFITFCPPHPDTIPKAEANYGVPRNWPSAIKVTEEEVNRLRQVSIETQREFTQVFNEIIAKNSNLRQIDNAFRLVSNIGTLYNYFDFYGRENLESEPYQIYMGNSFKEASLDKKWKERVSTKEKKIMITLGTFLSYRKDVLEKLILYVRNIYPDSLLIVSAGNNAKDLDYLSGKNTIINAFIPQIGLMPYMDSVLFHGGCNTLTEAVYYGKEMMILPFSSDQFNIAYDIEKNNLGAILDPNHFDEKDVEEAFKIMDNNTKESVGYWSQVSKQRGAEFVSKVLLGKDKEKKQ